MVAADPKIGTTRCAGAHDGGVAPRAPGARRARRTTRGCRRGLDLRQPTPVRRQHRPRELPDPDRRRRRCMPGAGRRRGLRPDCGDDVPGRLRHQCGSRIAGLRAGGTQSNRTLHWCRHGRRQALRSGRARRRRLRREGLPAADDHPADGVRSRSRCQDRVVTHRSRPGRTRLVEPQSAPVPRRTSGRCGRPARHRRRPRGVTRPGADRRRHDRCGASGARRGTTGRDRLRGDLRRRDAASRGPIRRPAPTGAVPHRRGRPLR